MLSFGSVFPFSKMKRVFVTKKQIDCVKVRVECRDVFCQELLALDLLFLFSVKVVKKNRKNQNGCDFCSVFL